MLASNTQILTSVPQELTPDNITTAALIVQELLVSSNVTEVSGVTVKPMTNKTHQIAPERLCWFCDIRKNVYIPKCLRS